MTSQMPIAIIGMGCRFAGEASSPEKLWKLCAEAKSAWSEFPASRFNKDAFYHPNGQKLNTVSVAKLSTWSPANVMVDECQGRTFLI